MIEQPEKIFYRVLYSEPRFDNVDPYNSFQVFLETDFAKKCLDRTLTKEEHTSFQKVGDRTIKANFKNNKSNNTPFTFYNNSLLISSINIPSIQSGCWLAAEKRDIDNEEFVRYYPHNVDRAGEQYLLMNLFYRWQDYADILLE